MRTFLVIEILCEELSIDSQADWHVSKFSRIVFVREGEDESVGNDASIEFLLVGRSKVNRVVPEWKRAIRTEEDRKCKPCIGE